MASVNKVILVGNVGADPETRYLPSGDPVTNLRLATSETWKDKTSGEKKEATEWHRCVLFRKLAEIAGQYVKKGSQLYLEGQLRTRKWTDKDGQERYQTEIEVTEMKMLGSRQGAGQGDSGSGRPAQARGNAGGGGGNGEAPARAPAHAGGFDGDDDIPFAEMSMAYDPAFAKATRGIRRTA